MDVGYGVAGASVQLGDTSENICTDREIMKKTLMRGKATVYCSDVCDSLRKQKLMAGRERSSSNSSIGRRSWRQVSCSTV